MWTYREFLELQEKDMAHYEEKLSRMNAQNKKKRTESPSEMKESKPEEQGIVFIIDR